jgi:hypothetical protein
MTNDRQELHDALDRLLEQADYVMAIGVFAEPENGTVTSWMTARDHDGDFGPIGIGVVPDVYQHAQEAKEAGWLDAEVVPDAPSGPVTQ